MSPASSQSFKLARELLDLEAKRAGNPGHGGSAATAASRADHVMQVFGKLRGTLTGFAGIEGFRSLLARALVLAKAQDPSLASVQVLEDGALWGLGIADGDSSAAPNDGAGSAGQVLIAHVLDLLVILIGEPLTHQLARSTWPDSPPDAPRSRTKDTP